MGGCDTYYTIMILSVLVMKGDQTDLLNVFFYIKVLMKYEGMTATLQCIKNKGAIIRLLRAKYR